jgi:hypothetical protein
MTFGLFLFFLSSFMFYSFYLFFLNGRLESLNVRTTFSDRADLLLCLWWELYAGIWRMLTQYGERGRCHLHPPPPTLTTSIGFCCKWSRYYEKDLLPYWSDCWNVLVYWPFHCYQPSHIVTKLFTASCKCCNERLAGQTSIRRNSLVHSGQIKIAAYSFQFKRCNAKENKVANSGKIVYVGATIKLSTCTIQAVAADSLTS